MVWRIDSPFFVSVGMENTPFFAQKCANPFSLSAIFMKLKSLVALGMKRLLQVDKNHLRDNP